MQQKKPAVSVHLSQHQNGGNAKWVEREREVQKEQALVTCSGKWPDVQGPGREVFCHRSVGALTTE